MTSSKQPGFEFGKNWHQFLSLVDGRRIAEAEASLRQMLDASALVGLRFLDVGCGSGLFSLAARRLGATVVSFDYDPQCVGCATELKNRYRPNDVDWVIREGSVLDPDFMRTLGTFDVVYSWGVLHHTGAMWRAVDHAAGRVAPGGRLFIAIYNDQGIQSRFWSHIKRYYNALPAPARFPYLMVFAMGLEVAALVSALGRLSLRHYLQRWTDYQSVRGMSRWHDLVDWIGGYPFEVARPEKVFEHCRDRGFHLVRLKTCGGRMGCNEFVFERHRPLP